MIEPMRKYSFVVFHHDYSQFLDSLRRLGVLHISDYTAEPDARMQDIMRRRAEVRQLRQQLQGLRVDAAEADAEMPDGAQLVTDVRNCMAQREECSRLLAAAARERAAYEPWADADLDADKMRQLADAGVELRLYRCKADRYDDSWQERWAVEPVSRTDGQVCFALLTSADADRPDLPDAEEVTLPSRSIAELDAECRRLAAEKAGLDARMAQYVACAAEPLDRYDARLKTEMQMHVAKVGAQSAADGTLTILSGFVPESSVSRVEALVDGCPGIVSVSEPARADDRPPVVLRNGRYSRLFEPVTRMFSLPSYGELDLTPFFAPFFMLFFGLCFGDAGYGLVVTLAVWIARRHLPAGMRGLCNLGLVLGGFSIVVSLATGMAFGVDLSDPAVGLPESVRRLFVTERNFTIGGYHPLMGVAVALGIVQILFGMCLRAANIARQRGARHAVSTVAWVALIVASAAAFGLPAAGVALPAALAYALYGIIGLGALLAFFYNSPERNPLVNFGNGVWTTYNMATGLLGDTLSYVRLFALGLTGGILGSVFNMLAFQVGDALPLLPRLLVVPLILLLGHGINFCLCLISAFVHPMRLTFVEFYKNAGFEGGGKEYEPLK